MRLPYILAFVTTYHAAAYVTTHWNWNTVRSSMDASSSSSVLFSTQQERRSRNPNNNSSNRSSNNNRNRPSGNYNRRGGSYNNNRGGGTGFVLSNPLKIRRIPVEPAPKEERPPRGRNARNNDNSNGNREGRSQGRQQQQRRRPTTVEISNDGKVTRSGEYDGESGEDDRDNRYGQCNIGNVHACVQ